MELIVGTFLIIIYYYSETYVILSLFKYFNISEIEMYLINQRCFTIKLVRADSFDFS